MNGASARPNNSSQIQFKLSDKTFSINVEETVRIKEIVERRKNLQLNEEDDNSLFVIDVGRVIHMYDQWIREIPAVTPFYAVKCNSDPVLLKVLAELGAGFDCASKQEIEKVLGLGVTPERIIFANPCKMISHLKYAARVGVKKMTFDCQSELHKIKEHCRNAELVVRIKPEVTVDVYQLGAKFGCSVSGAIELLKLAKTLELNATGVSFHCGSECDPEVFRKSIKQSLEIFREASTIIGYELSLLDIGGGFPGTSGSEKVLYQTLEPVKAELDHFKSIFPHTKIISEPGRYFVTSTHTLALMIHSKKTQSDGTEHYYLSDGGQGIFAVCLIFGCPEANTLKVSGAGVKQYPTVIWGPTAAPDKVLTTMLPELDVGDWLYFKDMGAYTRECGSYAFNGFPRPECYYYISSEYSERIKAFQDYAC